MYFQFIFCEYQLFSNNVKSYCCCVSKWAKAAIEMEGMVQVEKHRRLLRVEPKKGRGGGQNAMHPASNAAIFSR